ncbi:MAG: ATP-binding protein [Coriobacteriales bacterium]|jgi:nucleoside-triphosphatase THEP1|nr:ATP-binding protein [Coriobacteriales bacterium]
MTYKNPFTPVFGSEPPLFAGRRQLINSVLNGLANGPGDPYRIVIFTGPRGSGKTVLMGKIAADAEQNGWIAVHVAAEGGMLTEIIAQLQEHAAHLLPAASNSKLSGIQAAGFGVSIEHTAPEDSTWRVEMGRIMDILQEEHVGLLITVDEVVPNEPELIRFVSALQFFIREKRNIAVLFAGLSENVKQLLEDSSITFLRRAFMRELAPLSDADVRTTMKRTIELTEREISPEALEIATSQISGLPFLLQLIGYHIFNQSDMQVITAADAYAGIDDSKVDMDHMIFESTISTLTDVEKSFLLCMAQDDGDSKIANIAQCMHVSSSYVGNYRRKLIDRGIIVSAGRGKLRFAIPMLKDWLRTHSDLSDAF